MVILEKHLLSEQLYILIMSQVKGNMESMLMPSFWSKPPSKLWFHLLIGMAKTCGTVDLTIVGEG